MATNLQSMYEAATSDQLTRVKMQASGQIRSPSAYGSYPPVNFFPDDYQKEFKTRAAGDREIAQSFVDDDTKGSFQSNALNYYQELMNNNRLVQYRSKIVHPYNARSIQSHYAQLKASSPGVISQYGG